RPWQRQHGPGLGPRRPSCGTVALACGPSPASSVWGQLDTGERACDARPRTQREGVLPACTGSVLIVAAERVLGGQTAFGRFTSLGYPLPRLPGSDPESREVEREDSCRRAKRRRWRGEPLTCPRRAARCIRAAV